MASTLGSDGLQPKSDGLQPESFLLLVAMPFAPSSKRNPFLQKMNFFILGFGPVHGSGGLQPAGCTGAT